MPKNKLASFRYRVINNCLKNTARKWTMQDLMDEISNQLFENFGIEKGISKRTLQYDINLMRSLPPRGFDAPIVVNNGYYSYEDSQFSIENSKLNETDIDNINNAITLLSQFKQLHIHEELSVVKEKILGETMNQDENNKIIEFEHKQVKGTEFLSVLFKSIKDKRTIELEYKPFKADKADKLIIHPYLLKQYNHRWYLLGLCEKLQRIGVYSLDRIHEINHTDISYKLNTILDSEKYFKDIIGVTVPEGKEVQEIILKVAPDQVPYIKTKPIHSSQTILEEDETGMLIQLKLIPNYEFYSLILSYGDSVQVVSPEDVRLNILEKIKSTLSFYNQI